MRTPPLKYAMDVSLPYNGLRKFSSLECTPNRAPRAQ